MSSQSSHLDDSFPLLLVVGLNVIIIMRLALNSPTRYANALLVFSVLSRDEKRVTYPMIIQQSQKLLPTETAEVLSILSIHCDESKNFRLGEAILLRSNDI